MSGAILGTPVISLVDIDRALEEEASWVRALDPSPDGPVERCVEALREQLADVSPPNALIAFVRNGRDMFMLSVRRGKPDLSDEDSFYAHVTILEPLSTTRAKRTVARATLSRHRDPVTHAIGYAAALRVSEGDDGISYSYEGLLLIDKVLSRLSVAPHTERDVNVAWVD